MEGKCPNCGWFPEFPEEDEPFDEIKWAYTKTDNDNKIRNVKVITNISGILIYKFLSIIILNYLYNIYYE